MDCSTPGFPAHHLFPELAQTHIHRVGHAIQPMTHSRYSEYNPPDTRRVSSEPDLRPPPGIAERTLNLSLYTKTQLC